MTGPWTSEQLQGYQRDLAVALALLAQARHDLCELRKREVTLEADVRQAQAAIAAEEKALATRREFFDAVERSMGGDS